MHDGISTANVSKMVTNMTSVTNLFKYEDVFKLDLTLAISKRQGQRLTTSTSRIKAQINSFSSCHVTQIDFSR